jgi:hypothetical protein
MKILRLSVLFVALGATHAATLFDTGAPDGSVAAQSGARLGFTYTGFSTADDFILLNDSFVSGGTFTGLITPPIAFTDIVNVTIGIYSVSPTDAFGNPNPSPGGLLATRASASGQITYTRESSDVDTATRTVPTATRPIPFFGGGLTIDFAFPDPILLPAGHYFFSPQVVVTNVVPGPPEPGSFYWLSAPWPVGDPATDYSASFRGNGDIGPPFWIPLSYALQDGPYNTSFSLRGEATPEPASAWLILASLAAIAGKAARTRLTAR